MKILRGTDVKIVNHLQIKALVCFKALYSELVSNVIVSLFALLTVKILGFERYFSFCSILLSAVGIAQ